MSDVRAVAEDLALALARLEQAARHDPALRAALWRVHAGLAHLLERAESPPRAPSRPEPRASAPEPKASAPEPKASAPEPRASAPEPEASARSELQRDARPRAEPPRAPAVAAEPRPGALESARLREEPADERPARRSEPQDAADLALVARRTRLKAEACRWAAERRRRLEEGRDDEETVRPRDHELVRRAKELPNCFLWPLSRYEELPSDAQLETLAGTYEALGAAAQLCLLARERAEEEEPALEGSYQLLAEAQSALRAAVSSWTSQRLERDQDDAFHWLRRRTEEDRVYVARHMRLQDPADPHAWHGLLERIEEERARLERAREGERRVQQGLNRLRYHAQRAADPLGPEDAREHAVAIARTLDELLEAGLRPSDVRLREILLPLQDELPEDLEPSRGLAQVLAELDRYLALSEAEEGARAAPAEPTAEVARVRELLRGQRVVLIGGQERHRSGEALERAFELEELRWISSEPHTSLSAFEPEIARPQTKLVLLAIRWSSHSYEGVKDLCRAHDKVFVRLPRGYGPNQVAHAILEQASRQLA